VCAHAAPTGNIDVTTPEMLDAWLRVVGPTSAVLWQHLARRLIDGTFATSAEELGEWSGVGPGVVWNSLDRLAGFARVVWINETTLTVQIVADRPRWMFRQPVTVAL
jgi:hypothetical protein